MSPGIPDVGARLSTRGIVVLGSLVHSLWLLAFAVWTRPVRKFVLRFGYRVLRVLVIIAVFCPFRFVSVCIRHESPGLPYFSARLSARGVVFLGSFIHTLWFVSSIVWSQPSRKFVLHSRQYSHGVAVVVTEFCSLRFVDVCIRNESARVTAVSGRLFADGVVTGSSLLRSLWLHAAIVWSQPSRKLMFRVGQRPLGVLIVVTGICSLRFVAVSVRTESLRFVDAGG